MIRNFSIALFFLALIAYIVFQGRFVIFGPRIIVDTPVDGSNVEAGLIEVKGTAENISSLSLDDHVIFTDTKGHFDEKLIASPGTNIIKLDAKNRFGREKVLLIRIYAQ